MLGAVKFTTMSKYIYENRMTDKEYVQYLEDAVRELELENTTLKKEIAQGVTDEYNRTQKFIGNTLKACLKFKE